MTCFHEVTSFLSFPLNALKGRWHSSHVLWADQHFPMSACWLEGWDPLTDLFTSGKLQTSLNKLRDTSPQLSLVLWDFLSFLFFWLSFWFWFFEAFYLWDDLAGRPWYFKFFQPSILWLGQSFMKTCLPQHPPFPSRHEIIPQNGIVLGSESKTLISK